MKNYDIAVIPGDGIGREVIPEGIKVLETVSSYFDFNFTWTEYDWSCEHYAKTGRMMPLDGLEQLSEHDSI